MFFFMIKTIVVKSGKWVKNQVESSEGKRETDETNPLLRAH
jgi:hypothetical protein